MIDEAELLGMDWNENSDGVHRELERLVNLHATVVERARKVYEITQQLVDSVPEEDVGFRANWATNNSYDLTLRADKIVAAEQSLRAVGVFPRYDPIPGYWSRLEGRSDEQRTRLDHHLRFVCLRDTGDLEVRREAALAVIDGIAGIHKQHDLLFYLSDRRNLTDADQRLLDGIVSLSLKFVETIAGVIRDATRIVPPQTMGL